MLRLMAAGLLVLMLLASACGSKGSPEGGTPSRLTGVVTEVHIENDTVDWFVVQAEGAPHKIFTDPNLMYAFDLRHLEDHRNDGSPVAVEVETRDGRLYAWSILDA